MAFGKGTATNSHFPAIRHKSICCRRVDFGPKWMDGWDEIGGIGGNVSGCTLKARIGTNEYGNISIAFLIGLSSFPMEVTKGREGPVLSINRLRLRKTSLSYPRHSAADPDRIVRRIVWWADKFFQLLPNYAIYIMHPLSQLLTTTTPNVQHLFLEITCLFQRVLHILFYFYYELYSTDAGLAHMATAILTSFIRQRQQQKLLRHPWPLTLSCLQISSIGGSGFMHKPMMSLIYLSWPLCPTLYEQSSSSSW